MPARQKRQFKLLLGVGMGFVVDVHQLADRSVSVFLRGGERLVAEEFLNGAEIGAVGEQVSSKSVAQRVRVQVPVHIGQANVFFDDAADGTLRQAAAGVIEKNRIAVRRTAAAAARPSLQQKMFANWPI